MGKRTIPSHITNNIALGTKLFTIWGKDVYYGGDMLHNFQSNTNVDIPGAINYIQLGTGATHTINDFYKPVGGINLAHT